MKEEDAQKYRIKVKGKPFEGHFNENRMLAYNVESIKPL